MDSNNIGEAEDRISNLPDSLLHHILSFLDDIKHVARTSLLSRRWSHIWTSIPTLRFLPFWPRSELPSLSQANTFMDFVDKTVDSHDGNIQEFHLHTSKHFNGDRVHSWISIITRKHRVQRLHLYLNLYQPFLIPLSLFTCQSLVELNLDATNTTTQLPKSFSFPQLKILRLSGIEFTDGCRWNEQHFSNCRVLENLYLDNCTWLGVENFCIWTPTLKQLWICNTEPGDEGLQYCALKIHAPNMVTFYYWGRVAKEYVFSIQKLKSASVYLVPKERQRGYGAGVSKFFQALSHVESLTLDAETLKTMAIVDEVANILPTFHNLKELELSFGESTDKSLVLLLKAAPNVTSLTFNECIDNNKESKHDWAALLSKSGCLLRHLKVFSFGDFSVKARQMRWLELILKNAETLESITLSSKKVKNKEVILSKLRSLPRASDRCKIEFEE